MSLPELCIRHKAAVAILAAVAFLAGVLSWRAMNQELIPNISMPTIYIAIPYEGASADQINDKITKILENEFSTMPNLTEMTATNFSGVSLMLLTFDDSIDLYTKILDVREVINQNKSRLPEDIREPIIAFGGATDIPIFSFAIISDSDFEELVRFAEEELIPELSHLHGVAEVEIDGYKRRQVDITLRMDDLSANGVSALEVFGALSTKSVSIPAGYATFQKKTVSLKTVSESADLEEIRNIIVGSANGAPIYLENVADVELRYNEKSRDITTDGKEVIVVSVKRRSDGNAVQIIEESKEILADFRAAKGNSIDFQTLEDDSTMVIDSINSIIESAVLGIVLAVLIILLFLRDTRSTIIIGTSIPLSIVCSIICMNAFGISINFLSLCGITVALGMVVDNSIVVYESIFTQRDKGMDAEKSAAEGSRIVGGAILASTTTTACVFIPLLFLGGIAGIFFKDISLTLVFSIIASLVSALTVVPAMCARFLRGENRFKPPRFLTVVSDWVENGLQRLSRFYGNALETALTHRKTVLAFAVLILVISALLISMMGVIFLPPTDYSNIKMEMTVPGSYTFEQSKAKVREVEDKIVGLMGEDLTRRVFFVNNERTDNVFFMNAAPITATLFLKPVGERKKGALEWIEELEEVIGDEVTDCEVVFTNGGLDYLLRYVTGGDKIYSVSIEGNDLDIMYKAAVQIENLMKQDPEIYKTKKSMDLGSKEAVIRLDPDRMGTMGIDSKQAAFTTRILFSRTNVGVFSQNGMLYDMYLSSDYGQKPITPESLENIYIRNMMNGFSALATFSDISFENVATKIDRKDRKNVITITGFADTNDLSGIQSRMDAHLEKMNLPYGVSWQTTGAGKLVQDMLKDVLLALGVAIFLVYAVMVIQFNRFSQPFIILLSIPFCLIGVILGLMIFGSQISLIALLGIIALAGVVVNNAIVLVDYINFLRDEKGMELRPAIIAGCQNRLRPILMTTLTTLFGVLPLAFSRGNGAEVYAPLGQAIFGGLLTSTLITLVLIPILYEGLEIRKLRRMKAEKEGGNG